MMTHPDLSYNIGDNFELYGQLHGDDWRNFDLNGANVYWTLASLDRKTVYLAISSTNTATNSSVTVVNANNGVVAVSVNASDTKSLPAQVLYDQLRVVTSTVTVTMWSGRIKMLPSLFSN